MYATISARMANRHVFLHGGRVKTQAQGVWDSFSNAAPPYRGYFSNFELKTRAAFTKAAFGTLCLFGVSIIWSRKGTMIFCQVISLWCVGLKVAVRQDDRETSG